MFTKQVAEKILAENPITRLGFNLPNINENGELITPTEPNGYKIELLVLDMIHMMDNNLAYEVEREKGVCAN